ncbi:MAG TPA: glycine zipper family protein [Alphaproteobacteria bacterium]|nr:glycine zipper family protein [Alphaproteobacteria bacterium]
MRRSSVIATISIMLSSLLLSACADSYQPVVDMKHVDPNKYQADLAECRQYANQVDVAGDAGTDALVGAGIGAAGGAVLGAITGSAGMGAAIGAAGGGIAGGTGGGLNSGQRQKNIINNCLKGRGYKVLG